MNKSSPPCPPSSALSPLSLSSSPLPGLGHQSLSRHFWPAGKKHGRGPAKNNILRFTIRHGCMAKGSHGLPKVSHGPALPFLFTLCGRATPEMTLRPYQGWPVCRAGGLRPSSIPLDTPRRKPMRFDKTSSESPFLFWKLR
jgi:hypothetical protein